MNYNELSINKKRKELRSKKKRIKTTVYSMIARISLLIFACILIAGAGFMYGSYRGMIHSAPSISNLSPKNSASVIYDDTDHVVQQLSDYSSNRILIPYSEIPDNLKNAFIAIEDERFYEHHGIDFKGIMRALIIDLKTGSASQGASTLTQQLIKNNVFEAGGEDNIIAKIKRKIQEQYLAIQIEKTYSKENILTDYLNTINLGKGTLGVEAASKFYFNKSAKDLTLSECAVLAGITKNPTSLNPADHPDANNVRRKLILKKMNQANYISNEDYQAALNDDVYSRIANNMSGDSKTATYSYFTDALITRIVSDLQEKKGYSQTQAYHLVYRGGLRIYSTQDSKLQKIADNIINDPANYPVDTKYSLEYKLQVTRKNGTARTFTQTDVRTFFRKKDGNSGYKTIYSSKKEMKKAVKRFRKSVLKKGDSVENEQLHYSLEPQLSYTLIDQKTGQVKVLVGGRGKKQDDLALNRATTVKRQPGSTFKVLSTYAPALDTGGMTLATVFDDAPYRYENGDKVTNYVSSSYGGLTTIRDAIIKSNNIVAVKALTQITPQVGFDFLQKLGFTTLVSNRVTASGTYESDINQALSLGGITDGVTNLELTAAYATIANKGRYNEPVLYTKVTDSNGNVILSNEKMNKKIMKKSTAWLLTNAMEDVVKKGTGRKAQLASKMAVAGKTGTTSNNYDYWFCGYTPYYTASVWTGYDYNTSFSNEGDYHKVIWKKIMDQVIAEKQQTIRSFPSCKGIQRAKICIKSGKKAVPDICKHDPEKNMVRNEYFASGTVPKDSCDAHIAVTICSLSNKVATKYCPENLKHTKIFRVRPDNSSGQTADSKYCLKGNIMNDKCNIHTRNLPTKEEQQRLLKETEDLKKKQDKTLKDIRKQMNNILN
ncbi:MAG: PBP1A family penicillin-binding protein [Lachnospiraceae bacterium]|nr:PBP1A family penicillin-binding protein [Lachnospiraceae bacterium]MDY5496562.1 PBP1A family penicillin-binding protein [Anaerobutyricum sp.]